MVLVSQLLILSHPAGAALAAHAPGAQPPVSPLARLTDDDLLGRLDAERFWDRSWAAAEIARRGERLRPALLRLAQSGEAPAAARLRALALAARLWNGEVRKLCLDLLAAEEAEFVRVSVTALGEREPSPNPELENRLLPLLSDHRPAVRGAAALALGRVGGEAAADGLVSALRFDAGKDLEARAALARGLERLGALGVERLLGLAESDRDQDRAAAVAAFALLHSREAYAALPRLLANPHLTEAQTALLLRSYANFQLDPPVSLAPVVEWLAQHREASAECKLAALEVLRGAAIAQAPPFQALLLQMLRDDADPEVRLEVLSAVRATQQQAAIRPLMELLAARSRPAPEERAMIQCLRELRARDAADLLKSLARAPQARALHEEVWLALGALLTPEEARAFGLDCLRDDRAGSHVSAAAALVGSTPAGAKELADLYVQGKVQAPAAVVEGVLARYLEDAAGLTPSQAKELREALDQVKIKGRAVQPNSPPQD
jgi:quinoprotein glucose dehydrogenase